MDSWSFNDIIISIKMNLDIKIHENMQKHTVCYIPDTNSNDDNYYENSIIILQYNNKQPSWPR